MSISHLLLCSNLLRPFESKWEYLSWKSDGMATGGDYKSHRQSVALGILGTLEALVPLGI